MAAYFETAAHSQHRACDRIYLLQNDSDPVYLTEPNRTHGVSAMFCIHSDRHPEINHNIEGLRALQEWV